MTTFIERKKENYHCNICKSYQSDELCDMQKHTFECSEKNFKPKEKENANNKKKGHNVFFCSFCSGYFRKWDQESHFLGCKNAPNAVCKYCGKHGKYGVIAGGPNCKHTINHIKNGDKIMSETCNEPIDENVTNQINDIIKNCETTKVVDKRTNKKQLHQKYEQVSDECSQKDVMTKKMLKSLDEFPLLGS
jgi:hypothetical protein